MKRTTLITNGSLILPDRILTNGAVYMEDGLIAYAGGQGGCSQGADTMIDAQGGYILPGFIDMHSDAIEKEMEPRPGAVFSIDLAFSELEKKLAGQGITTMYHSFSFAGAEFGTRETRTAADSIRSIVTLARQHELIHNKIHLRFEITNYQGVDSSMVLLEEGMVHLFSFMDHTPGQGQYPTIQDYQRYLEKMYQIQSHEVEKILAEKAQGRAWSEQSIAVLKEAAQRLAIPLASHDDDSQAKVAYYRDQGVSINEFPVNLEAAAAAHGIGNFVCMGAPNIVRGGSSGKGIRAIDAIEAGYVRMICSDYYPASILHAVFKLAESSMSLPEAAAMASLHPARALGLEKNGSLEGGHAGDVIVVNMKDNLPVVTNTVVGGCLVYGIAYRQKDIAYSAQEGRSA